MIIQNNIMTYNYLLVFVYIYIYHSKIKIVFLSYKSQILEKKMLM